MSPSRVTDRIPHQGGALESLRVTPLLSSHRFGLPELERSKHEGQPWSTTLWTRPKRGHQICRHPSPGAPGHHTSVDDAVMCYGVHRLGPLKGRIACFTQNDASPGWARRLAYTPESGGRSR